MPTEVERLAVLIEANTKAYESAMKRLQAQTERAIRGSTRAVASLDARINALGATAARAARTLGLSFGVAGVMALGRSIRETVKDAGDLVDAANKIGISTDNLQVLRFAAEQSGESIEDLDSLMAMFTKRLGDAAQGSGELYDLLRLNGVALRNQAGQMRPVSDLLGEVADLIQRATSAQDKMNVATAAFGKAGGGAVNIFGQGAQGIRDFASEAEKAGIILDEAMLKKAAAVDDEWQKLTTRISTAWKSMILGIVNSVDDVAEAISHIGDHAGTTKAETAKSLRDFASLPGVRPEEAAFALRKAAEIESAMQFRGPGSNALAERDSMSALSQFLADKNKPGIVLPTTGGGGATTKATDLSDSVRMVTDEIEAMDDSLRESIETGRAFAETFISGMMSGKSAVESLRDALGGLADKLLNSGLDAIFGTGKAGGGLFSFLGGLGGGATVPGTIGMYADGGYIRPGNYGIVGEAGPELVRAGRGGMTVTPNGGGRSISVVTNIDARGAGPGVSGELRAALDARDARLRRELPALVAQAGGDPRRR